jgi:hypothetical protein
MATPPKSFITLPDGFYTTEEYFSDPQKFRCVDGWLGRRTSHLYDGIKVKGGVATLVLAGDAPEPEVVQAAPVSAPTPAPPKPAKKQDKGLWSLPTKELRILADKHGVDWPIGEKRDKMVAPIRAAIKAAQ